jgi:Rne/Rng family ribonuclease
MSKEMVVSANPHETRVAIMEEGQLCEYYVEREKEFALVGSIYKGRVTRVLPGMQSAFVDIGLDGDAFLYVSDFLEDIEEFDHIVTTAEDKIQKMEDQGGQAFAANTGTIPSLEPSDVESVPNASVAADAAGIARSSESFTPAESPMAPPASVFPAPRTFAPTPDRGRFERPRGGRDFGRRSGRPGRPGGRGGSGGGRGGDRRYGRELPPSKYASPRSYEDRPSDSGPAENYVPVILPGESFAKYRERPPMPAGSAPGLLENVQEHEVPTATPSAAPVETVSESAQEAAPQSHSEFQPSFSSTGLEPLPGESLSKWKTHEPPASESHALPVATPEHAGHRHEPHEHEEHEPHEERAEFAAHEIHETQEHPDAHAIGEIHADPDLSEEEATAVAEHIAEAQSDEAARHAEERAFNAESTGTSVSEAEEAASDAEEAAAEDAETLEAEAEAEAEGMIGPREELDHAETTEAEAMSASAENGSPTPSENPLAQESQPSKAQVRNDFRSRMQNPARRGGRDRGRREDRGRRPQHGHSGSHGHSRPQPRRTQLIADLLKQGQEIIVQIAKEPLGKKGARITSHVALPGRFLVYMPTLDHTGVSRKISSAEDRARLRHLVNEAKGSSGGGFIVRTAAASASPDEVRTDVEFLTRTWAEIKSRSEQRKAPSLLHRDLNLVERILRDYITPDFSAIWVDTEDEYTKVVEFMSRFQPQLVNRVKLYTKETPVFEEFGIQQEIDKGLRPKVWLKSGGYIVINHTEALVAIDVNTGKFVGKGSNRLEDTIVRTNLEAVKEIVRQMRLRDLGGIIVIDFIDMEDRRNREKVMAALEDALRADRAPSKMLRFNEFGLIAITRKRTKQALERTLCQPCPYCTGSGMVKSIPTLCYEIQTEARKMAPEMDSGSLTLRVHPEISKALKTRESSLVEELERWTKKSIIIQADPTLHWEQYDIY